jgi:hypothetical protein
MDRVRCETAWRGTRDTAAERERCWRGPDLLRTVSCGDPGGHGLVGGDGGRGERRGLDAGRHDRGNFQE